MSVKMIAEAKFKLNPGDKELLKNGDEFTTDLENGKDLQAMGFARFKASTLEDLVEESDEEQQPTPRRGSYRRRDVKVEH